MDNKITFLKEKQIEKTAQKNFEFLESAFVENPIKAKFAAFKMAKRNIKPDDLL